MPHPGEPAPGFGEFRLSIQSEVRGVSTQISGNRQERDADENNKTGMLQLAAFREKGNEKKPETDPVAYGREMIQ